MKEGLMYIVLTLLFTACGEQIDLPESPDLLVVEGWLTDKDTIHQIKLSRTVSFEAISNGTIVDNAQVAVKSTTTSESFHHTTNGIYLSDQSIKGIAGKEYWVEIELNGLLIQSEREKMSKVPDLDSIGYDYFERPSEFNPQVNLIIYYPIAFVSDNASIKNYYRWKFWKNNQLFSKPEDLFIQSDQFINGLDSIKNEFIDFNYELNDTIKVEFQEISANTYSYLRLLKLQTNSLGTRQGTTPAIVTGNLYVVGDPGQLVLGYFGAISSTSGETIINP